MRVVLVNPRDPGLERIQRKWKAYPPLGLLYLATALEGAGHTVEDTVRACELTKAAGLACHGSWFFGFPGETPDTIRETTRLIVDIKPTTVALGALRPYAGTAVYDQTKADGTLVGDWSAMRDDIPWIRLPWMNERQDLLRLVFQAKRTVYLRPHYLADLGAWAFRERNGFMARYAIKEALSVVRG